MLAGRFLPLRLLGVDTNGPRWPTLSLREDGLVLRPPENRDFEEWSRVREASRAFLTPWEPIWPPDDLTRRAFRRRVQRYNHEIASDESYPFFILEPDGRTLLGGLTLGNVRRGAAQCATLGYWMSRHHAGRGIMTRAVRIVCRFGFLRLRLERIEAACLPENAASVRVLEKAGFDREGFARAYLNIAGTRRDHILFGLPASDGA